MGLKQRFKVKSINAVYAVLLVILRLHSNTRSKLVNCQRRIPLLDAPQSRSIHRVGECAVPTSFVDRRCKDGININRNSPDLRMFGMHLTYVHRPKVELTWLISSGSLGWPCSNNS